MYISIYPALWGAAGWAGGLCYRSLSCSTQWSSWSGPWGSPAVHSNRRSMHDQYTIKARSIHDHLTAIHDQYTPIHDQYTEIHYQYMINTQKYIINT